VVKYSGRTRLLLPLNRLAGNASGDQGGEKGGRIVHHQRPTPGILVKNSPVPARNHETALSYGEFRVVKNSASAAQVEFVNPLIRQLVLEAVCRRRR